jgi:glucosylceramidase
MKRSAILLIAISSCLVSLSCSKDNEPDYKPPIPIEPEEEVVGSAQFWVTNGDKTKLLSQQGNLEIIDNTETNYPVITIDPATQFQEIVGFGAALTGSSAYLINGLGNVQKNILLRELFDVEGGIGISYLRLTIGASDFSLKDFTYNDLLPGEEDPELTQFSIAEDEKHIIPVFQNILEISPDIKIMGSPWSAPAWMKTNQSLQGGSLKPIWYNAYANYFVKYIKAYANYGITIDAITPQNEPLHEAGYPTMKMEASAQTEFIKNSLGPLFEAAGINTKIIAYDHNFDKPAYSISILEDNEANKYVSGTAFHAYAGDVSAMSVVHQAFPDKGLYFTEISGGEWATNFSDNLKWYMKNILIGTTKNWSKNALFWNLALNENFGPTNNGCQDCRGVVTIKSSGEIDKNVEYYSIGHFSKFVRPGARRIASTEFPSGSGLNSVSFKNTDNSKVLIVLNESSENKIFSVIINNTLFNASLEANAVASIIWN